ncbi:hypothetical protein PILCRDRAFT_827604 [Piloderma croceum F 1598]|uniref:Uncharacterized protein n=1 Tax=Piloderma croceum (strain F 1598) TaxID=765440 RepID=A0A0C3BCK2_PILCF|nr:hypothetical protein PILCRDRAFT_827604 [Piloderma croceum F 1598]
MPIGLAKTEIVALVLECCFFGIYTTLFWITLWILFTKSCTGSTSRPLVLTVFCMYILAIVHVSIDVHRAVAAFVDDANTPAGSMTVYGQLNSASEVAKTAIYAVQTILADSFCVWRCYIVWRKSWVIIILPVFMVLGTAVATSGVCWVLSHAKPGELVFESVLVPWITSSFVMTLVTNIICTAMIAFRIWQSQQRFKEARATSRLFPVMVMIIESGAIYSSALISVIATYATGNNAQYIIVDFVPSLIGIVFAMIIVRVGLGISSNGSQLTQSQSRKALTVQSFPGARSYQDTNGHYSMKALPISVDVHQESTTY